MLFLKQTGWSGGRSEEEPGTCFCFSFLHDFGRFVIVCLCFRDYLEWADRKETQEDKVKGYVTYFVSEI